MSQQPCFSLSFLPALLTLNLTTGIAIQTPLLSVCKTMLLVVNNSALFGSTGCKWKVDLHVVLSGLLRACLFMQIAALMKDKAALEARVFQAAVAPPAKTFKQIDTLPKYCCKTCG